MGIPMQTYELYGSDYAPMETSYLYFRDFVFQDVDAEKNIGHDDAM